jgi:predicted ester cyclase
VRDLTAGTQKGAFLGVPASGKKVSWSEYQFWHLANGKIANEWVTFDTLSLLR